MKAVAMWGGGITSWAVGRYAVDTHGPDNVTLLFADTKAEDADMPRFNADCERQLGVPLTVVADGRTPEQVDIDRRWLSNSRTAQCSFWLKIVPCRKWLDANCDPANTIVYVGIDWTEMERLPGQHMGYAHRAPGVCAKPKYCRSLFDENGRLEGPGCKHLLDVPWRVDAPLTRAPYRTKDMHIAAFRALGYDEPEMYRLGFEHNNCAGSCIRGGQAHWAQVLRVRPELFAAKEAHEKRMQDLLGTSVTVLKEQRGGTVQPLSLTELRQRLEGRALGLFDENDLGGCGCFVDLALTAS